MGTNELEPGSSYPLGATVDQGGVNFSVYSEHATGMELLLFDDVDAREPSRVLELHPRGNRTARYWHWSPPQGGTRQRPTSWSGRRAAPPWRR